MAELIEEYMPDEGYPYLLGSSEGTVMPQDFDERIDVIPISDPNISSNAQRVAKAQSVLELQQTYPNVIGERVAVKRMLEAIQAQNIEELIGTPEDWERQDQEAKAKQDDVDKIEKERALMETKKLETEVDNLRSDTTKNNLIAVQDSFEAAALAATNSELAITADALLKSAGFEDYDQGGLVPPMPVREERKLDPGLKGPEEQFNLPEQVSDEVQNVTGQIGPQQQQRMAEGDYPVNELPAPPMPEQMPIQQGVV